jgi:hypothetical protein
MVEDNSQSLRCAVRVADILRTMKAKGYTLPNHVWISTVFGGMNEMRGRTQWRKPILDDRSIGHRTVDLTLEISIPEAAPKTMSLDLMARVAFLGQNENETRVADLKMPTAQDENGPAFAIKTFDDIIIHEMGHMQAGARNDGGLTTDSLAKDESGPWAPNDMQWSSEKLQAANSWFQRAEKTISNYASKNTDEFLAEAFTVQYRGEKLSPDAQRLYDALKGPKVRA